GGIFLLSRDLQVSYVGRGIEDTLAANPVVTSAAVHPNGGYAYFTCSPTDSIVGGSTAGVRLCWDYLSGGIWSVDVLGDPISQVAGAAPRHGFIANATIASVAVPTYHWVNAAGVVYRETDGTTALTSTPYTDGGQWVTLSYSSPWIKFAVSGFARF